MSMSTLLDDDMCFKEKWRMLCKIWRGVVEMMLFCMKGWVKASQIRSYWEEIWKKQGDRSCSCTFPDLLCHSFLLSAFNERDCLVPTTFLSAIEMSFWLLLERQNHWALLFALWQNLGHEVFVCSTIWECTEGLFYWPGIPFNISWSKVTSLMAWEIQQCAFKCRIHGTCHVPNPRSSSSSKTVSRSVKWLFKMS